MSKIQNTHALGTDPIGKLLLQYSLPAIIGMTATSIYNIIDSIFIGHGVGSMALAGLTVTFPLMNLVVAFGTLVGSGGSAVTSIRLGQKNVKGATEVLGNVLLLCIINGVLFGAVTILFLDQILLYFGASAETLPYARDFMHTLLLGNPITYVFIGLNNLMRASGYPQKAMFSALLTVAVNLVFAPLFIFHFHWGIKGAAFSTIIAQFVGMVWVLSHFINKKSFVHFQNGFFKLKKRIILSIFSIGMAPFLMNVCAAGIVVLINSSLKGYGGDMAIGGYGIVGRVAMLFVMIVMGLTMGMQPIVGYNFGAKQNQRVKQTLKYAVFAGLSITTFGFVAALFFPHLIVTLFVDSHEKGSADLIQYATRGLQISLIAFPLVGCQIVIGNFFMSIGKAKISIFLSLTRQLLFLLPCLLLFPGLYGVDGVWISIPISDTLAFVVTILILVYHMKVLKRRELELGIHS